ncbi:ATP-grasp ribosomal peptide maturase [Actinomadura xylanilytica]|uniref:ATP-grasp ribosomal peptide maturase n=1 Tax=Actinomadura xylanilytica TaxID=887459 RepID=UPI00255ADF0A|nr:ATP-grasp ribosomal peptide maturase [Actinomadura xylanilytica]MDL4775315.1 ATP-grasp ribosomal peptide maturase [Actinomadura xylanilytica]
MTASAHGRSVLVLTSPEDPTADRVAAELAVRGVPVARLDTAQFPIEISMTATISSGDRWRGRLRSVGRGHDVLDLADVGGVYYRRPEQFVLDERMSAPERVFAYGEARVGFGGVVQALAGARWVNDPVAAARTEYKPVQLAMAAQVGLAVPATLITSDSQAAHDWATARGGPIIYKPMGGIWHGDEGKVRVLYTTRVEEPESLLDPAISRTANLFQEEVPKAFEARAVVVGNRVFAMRIEAGSERAAIDWRSDYDSLTYGELHLPAETCGKLVELHQRLGLVCGAVDLICDPDGRWVFLETNQGGEWGWLTQETGSPIAAAIADELTRGSE